ncbi:MAG: phosphate ABC transporter substrate-binding protein PstS [Spirochaetaceae bacterium]|nr:phosphate ABC transporter substrate-binding protein PstS [Spirochaetaceae bacterium]
MKRFRTSAVIAILVLIGSAAMAFGQAGTSLLGAGATFPAPLYTKMFDVYASETGVKVNYQGIGSSGGLKNVMDRVVDFGGSDSFVKDADFAKYPAAIVHIPATVGAVVMVYNLPGSPSLRLTGDIISDIYLGNITKWNDSAIKAVNPGIALPGTPIMPVYRSDGSGTTFNFTAYLSSVSTEWKSKVGNANSVSWPIGQGAAQNSGVAGVVKQTQGSIGYVELAYANQNNLTVATLKNASGNWIQPSTESISAAASIKMPKDTRIVLANTASPQGYPISSLTWIVVYQDQSYGGRSREQAKALVNLLWWMIHDGQKYAAPLDYAPLPQSAVKDAEDIIENITYGGQKLR